MPETVSAIILKLLSKTAEDRYQTAAGLTADLRKCLTEWESCRRISSFSLGAHDISDRLLIPEKLYGRDRQIKTLLDAFDQVVTTGKPNLVLVSGYSGIGKSSVVNELHKVLVPPRGLLHPASSTSISATFLTPLSLRPLTALSARSSIKANLSCKSGATPFARR